MGPNRLVGYFNLDDEGDLVSICNWMVKLTFMLSVADKVISYLKMVLQRVEPIVIEPNLGIPNLMKIGKKWEYYLENSLIITIG